MSIQESYKGVIHGKVIELDQELGLPDGQPVSVIVQPVETDDLAPGEGLRRSFGAWADEKEAVDEYLEWSRQQRNLGRLGD